MEFEFDKMTKSWRRSSGNFVRMSPRPLPDRVLPNTASPVSVGVAGRCCCHLVGDHLGGETRKWKPGDTPPVANQVSTEPVTLGQFRGMTDDPAQLDSQLDSLSRVLPDVRRTGGVLSKLAQESH